MTADSPAIAALLPHGPPMRLLDEVLEYDGTSVTVAATIRADHPFFDAGASGIPCHVGIELMAQACGTFAGLRAAGTGHPPALGFLLGTRHFQAAVRWFGVGQRLVVSATVAYLDGEMGVFDCRISVGLTERASAQLTVYQPVDAAAVLAGGVGS